MKRHLGVVFVVVVVCAARPAHAFSWGGVWDHVKGAATSVAHGVSAGVNAVGSFVSWGAGATVGQGVAGAIDPTIDHAAERFKEAGDHLIDHAGDVLSQKLAAAEAQFDDIAKHRIDQVDVMMGKRIDQLDTIAEKSLKTLNDIIDQALLHESQIIDNALNREDQILNTSLNRVEAFLDRDVTAMQGIETDAMDRIQTTVRDDVPFAAEQVTREIEWAIFSVILLGVLVGYGGVTLFRQYRKVRGSHSSTSARIKAALQAGFAEYASVTIPVLTVAVLLQAGYVLYYHHADHKRLADLRSGATQLERQGEFAEAAVIRRELQSFDRSGAAAYAYRRDVFLAKFLSPSLSTHTVAWPAELAALRTYREYARDDEANAAALYLQEKAQRGLPIGSPVDTALAKLLDDYVRDHITGKAVVPTLGKLVVMSRIRLLLDDPTRELSARVDAAIAACNELLAVSAYKDYAAGRLLRAELLVMKHDVVDASPDGHRADKNDVDGIAADLEAAAATEPDLIRLAQFATYDLSDDTSSLLYRYRKPDATVISDADHKAYLAAVDAANKLAQSSKPDDPKVQDAFAAIEKEDRYKHLIELRDQAAAALDAEVENYTRVAQFAYGSPAVARVVANEQFDRVVRRNQGMRDFHDLVEKARSAAPPATYALARDAAAAAYDAGELLLAEEWYQSAIKLAPPEDPDKLKAKLSSISSNKVTGGLAYVFD